MKITLLTVAALASLTTGAPVDDIRPVKTVTATEVLHFTPPVPQPTGSAPQPAPLEVPSRPHMPDYNDYRTDYDMDRYNKKHDKYDEYDDHDKKMDHYDDDSKYDHKKKGDSYVDDYEGDSQYDHKKKDDSYIDWIYKPEKPMYERGQGDEADIETPEEEGQETNTTVGVVEQGDDAATPEEQMQDTNLTGIAQGDDAATSEEQTEDTNSNGVAEGDDAEAPEETQDTNSTGIVKRGYGDEYSKPKYHKGDYKSEYDNHGKGKDHWDFYYGSNFFLSPAVPHKFAKFVCKKLGGELAELSAKEVRLVGRGLYKVGSRRPVWIHSYNGDDYRGAPIALYPGKFGGAVAIPPRVKHLKLHALCEKKDGHHKY